MSDWVDINLPWSVPSIGKCFFGSKYAVPGVLIEVQEIGEHGEKSPPKKYLIGHINKNGGTCDDCTAFEADAIVLRAKILVDSDILNSA